MRKILYSPGYGAGWTSWCVGGKKMVKFMLEYQPIIEYLEKGNSFNKVAFDKVKYQKNGNIKNPKILPDCFQQFVKECFEQFGEIPYLGGGENLKVMEVDGLVRVEDCDGFEIVHIPYDDWI